MVHTERLDLLKPSISDRDIFSEILSSPIQSRYLPNESPYTQEQQEEYLNNRINHWKKYGFGTFIITLKSSPSVKLGFVGAEYSPNPDYIDIRFGITSQFEGKGYITEASNALAVWFFENTEHKKLYGVSMVENIGSKAVLKKMGMTPEYGVDLYSCEGLENFSLVSQNV